MSCHQHTGSEGSVFPQFVALQRLLWGGLNLVCQDFGEGDDKSQQWKKYWWARTRRACLLTNKNVMVLLKIWVCDVKQDASFFFFFQCWKTKLQNIFDKKKKKTKKTPISTQTLCTSFTSNFTSLFQGFQLHFMIFLSTNPECKKIIPGTEIIF